jgi:hypothetical protein|tara:strand:+ start:820 stop:993 length:174 start_codon:yes stop_codon:yes gene_type:complete
MKEKKINNNFFNMFNIIKEFVEEENDAPVSDVSIGDQQLGIHFKVEDKDYTINLIEA